MVPLMAQWQVESDVWQHHQLDELEAGYDWVGLYVKARLEDTKAAPFAIIGGLTDGRKAVLAVESGQQGLKSPGPPSSGICSIGG